MLVVFLLAATVGASGCVVRAQTSARVAPPPPPAARVSVVAVQPGVWVVEDYHQPVFFSNNVYWMWDGAYWYQTPVWGGGWNRVTVSAVPVTVRRIDRPRRYVRYRARGTVRRRYVNARRDNRAVRRNVRRDNRAVRRDVRRDNRQERRDVRRDNRQERRDVRRDNRRKRRD